MASSNGLLLELHFVRDVIVADFKISYNCTASEVGVL